MSHPRLTSDESAKLRARALLYFQRGRTIGWIARTLQRSKETVSRWLDRPCREVAVEDWASTRRKAARVEAVVRRVPKLPGVMTWPEFYRLVGPGISWGYTLQILGPMRVGELNRLFKSRRAEAEKLRLIFALRKVADRLGRTPTGVEFVKAGYSDDTIRRVFGSVRAAQVAIGCKPHAVGEWRPRYRTPKTAAKLAAKAVASMRRMSEIMAFFLTLTACETPIPSEPMARSAVVREAERIAARCAEGAFLVVRPWATIQYRLADDLPGDHEGLTRGPVVYILRAHRDHRLVIAHELLHAVYGLPGMTAKDHPPIFEHCWLAQGQI